jgi:hypothetical protein
MIAEGTKKVPETNATAMPMGREGSGSVMIDADFPGGNNQTNPEQNGPLRHPHGEN